MIDVLPTFACPAKQVTFLLNLITLSISSMPILGASLSRPCLILSTLSNSSPKFISFILFVIYLIQIVNDVLLSLNIY